jgi:hypothetical protein
VNSALVEYYRCPEIFADLSVRGPLTDTSGYFRFGTDTICYGRYSGAEPAPRPSDGLHDALRDVATHGSSLQLPFDPSEIISNLRLERYASSTKGMKQSLWASPVLREMYYLMRPALPVSVRKQLQRMRLRDWTDIEFPGWPVDQTVERILERLLVLVLRTGSVEKIPFIWFWPHGTPGCVILTHDVETAAGRDFCPRLMDLDDAYGIKSSFQIIPEGRYAAPPSFLEEIRRRGFEINVHDLNHDGRLFHDRELFLRRVERINRYGVELGASGLRSAALYRNLDWFNSLNFSYDMSVPSVGHLEAQRGGCCSVTPFFIGNILELPVTVAQDYSLFHILNQYSTTLWKRQVDRIVGRNGLASFIVHPDYLAERPAWDTYASLLAYVADPRSQGKVWIPLPGEVNRWWRARSQMQLVRRGIDCAIEGPDSDQAQVAYAVLDGDRLAYEFSSAPAELVR